MKLSDHLPKFACKQLKHDLGITTVEEALTYSEDELKRSKGVGTMFCYHLRQLHFKELETKCSDRQIGLHTIMEKVKLPSNFQIGESVGLQGLIDLLEESKDGKVVAANFTDQKVKYTISVPYYRNGVEIGYLRLANIDSALINVPFDNEFHYNSKRDIQFREDQLKPRPSVECKLDEISNRLYKTDYKYISLDVCKVAVLEEYAAIKKS